MAKYVDLDKIIANLEETVEKNKVDTSEENAITAWIFKRFITELKKVPSEDVVPVRHGEWCGTVCSACGESTSFYYDCDYCPCCGAKMDGEENA